MVEPMSFDRIGNLGNSSTMKARLQEEVRLVELAQGTRVRYTDMGVFSAVAGNQWSPIQQQMHDQINSKKESYRLSYTCGAPRNHTNVPPVYAHVWRQLHLSAFARCSDSYCIFIDICYIYFDTLMLGVSHAVEVLVLCLLVKYLKKTIAPGATHDYGTSAFSIFSFLCFLILLFRLCHK